MSPERARFASLCLMGLIGVVATLRASPADVLPDLEASGAPMLTRFTTEHYTVMPQHNTLTTDATGRVFIGNIEGLLIYSADRFEYLKGAGDLSIRTLNLAHDGRALVGAYDHFGYFDERPDGGWNYHDLTAQFAALPGALPIGQVWLATELADGVYFQGERHLYRVQSDGGTAAFATPGPVMMALHIGDEIWVRVADQGLMRFDGNGFVTVPGGEAFAAFGVQSAAPHPQGTLFGSRANGLYLGDRERGLRHVDTPYDDWLKRAQVYAMTQLPDGDYALGTLSGEVAIIDAAFTLKKRYRISNYPVTDVASGIDGGLWIATDGELIRMDWPSPWTMVGDESGLFGTLSDAVWFEGHRWVATTMGLFKSTTDMQGRAVFEPQRWAPEEVWDLQPVGADLMVAERHGVIRVRGDRHDVVAKSEGAFELIPSEFSQQRMLVLETTAILELERRNDWELLARHDLGDITVSTLVELDASHWMIGNWRGYPALITRSESVEGPVITIRELGADVGMAGDIDGGSSVWRLDGKVYATLGDALHEWTGERFVPRPEHPVAKLAGDRLNELEVRGQPGAHHIFTSRNVWQERNGGWEPLRAESKRANGVLEVVEHDDGRLSLVTWGGVLTYDPTLAVKAHAEYHLRMHRAIVYQTGREARWLDRRGTTRIDVPPSQSLRFEYGIDGHDSSVEYRTRLDGSEAGAWTDWGMVTVREFDRLAPGDYRLHIQARPRGGQPAGPELSFPFRVLPRWYQTRTAAWGVALGVLGVGSVLAWLWGRYRSRKLRQRNAELEREIAAHTRELEVANQRLSKLAVQDGLTGITNRRGFEQFFLRTWNRLAETRESLAVLMVDVDYFKQYNDAHGHLLGDEMLRGIARELEQEVKEPQELLARFGGEEFVVVLPGVDVETASARAHAIRMRCETFGAPHDITVSVGLAACVPRGGLKAKQLLDEADAALYRAKKLGRNRVERGRSI